MDFNIIEKIIELLKNKLSFAIAIIIDKSGSSPRSSGSSIIISNSGNFFGSIGGGKLEAKLIKVTQRIIKKKSSFLLKIDLDNKEAGNLGMVCGGFNCILVYNILYDRKILMFFLQFFKEKGEFILTLEYTKKKILHNIICVFNDFSYSELFDKSMCRNSIDEYIKFYLNKKKKINYGENLNVFLPVIRSKKLFILGGGHISYSIVKIISVFDFDIIIVDDRTYFANRKRFPNVFEIKIVNFNLGSYLNKIDSDSSIIIVTRGHLYDKKVLEISLLKKNRYTGMIGSIGKKRTVYNGLKINGFSSKNLRKVHSPIGINICGESPEEISFSIVSEIILVNSRKEC